MQTTNYVKYDDDDDDDDDDYEHLEEIDILKQRDDDDHDDGTTETTIYFDINIRHFKKLLWNGLKYFFKDEKVGVNIHKFYSYADASYRILKDDIFKSEKQTTITENIFNKLFSVAFKNQAPNAQNESDQILSEVCWKIVVEHHQSTFQSVKNRMHGVANYLRNTFRRPPRAGGKRTKCVGKKQKRRTNNAAAAAAGKKRKTKRSMRKKNCRNV